MLKVGDKIVTLIDGGEFFSAGQEGIIISLRERSYYVSFGEGENWYVSHDNAKLVENKKEKYLKLKEQVREEYYKNSGDTKHRVMYISLVQVLNEMIDNVED